MFKVAVTGGASSGKTLVLKEFKRFFPVFNADEEVAFLYKEKSVQLKLLQEFGSVKKKEIKLKVFSDKKKLLFLQKLMWPLVFKKLKNFFKKNRSRIVVAEIPLLFESKSEKLFDLVITVHSSRKQQIKRLKKKGLSEKEAVRRITAQFPLSEKVSKADFVIDNSKSVSSTKRQALLISYLLSNL